MSNDIKNRMADLVYTQAALFASSAAESPWRVKVWVIVVASDLGSPLKVRNCFRFANIALPARAYIVEAQIIQSLILSGQIMLGNFALGEITRQDHMCKRSA